MSLLPSARFRSAVGAVVAALTIIGLPDAGRSHEDHGLASPTADSPSSPRLVAVSEAYELVGILKDGALVIFLDRMADTSPVVAARIDLTLDGTTIAAEPRPDGTYRIASAALARPGTHEAIITIAEDRGSDLMVGSLTIPDDHTAADHVHDGDGGWSAAPALMRQVLERLGLSAGGATGSGGGAYWLAGIGLVCGVLVGALVRGRAGVAIALVGLATVLGASVAWAGVAWAGPGHDHGEGAGAAAQGDAPRRLPDGELFLPKPTQRLLAIRTRVVTPETVRSAERLIGRVIADPNRSGLVQSTIGGRVQPSEGGLPALGQQVKKGDVLAYVEPAFAPIDASDVRQTAGDLAQRVAVLDARIARQKRLVANGVVNAASLEDLEIERDGLIARRAELTKARSEPEVLVAPVDGVLAEVRVVAGQVVSSADTLFNVVDPASLWVEAISFDPRVDAAGTVAKALTADGKAFALTFVGRSRALQQQATVLHFKVDTPGDELNIGSPVKVLIERGEAVTGLILPRSAIAQAPNGQFVAFKRLEPERYLPVAVRTTDLDGERVVVTAGLAAGDQIVIEGAALVNQIR
ncbi:MAG: efflux RND transporter periplasmic adaptor subunit [Hyphomicrobiaceae bacterium]|nr:efflux RND transporter periplasmic adaptor subunit [Hyphomicrobiaceae bacterium]